MPAGLCPAGPRAGPPRARVTLDSDGSALVEIGTHEIGGGTYTVMCEVAGDALGLTPEKVTVRLGHTRLPYAHPSIGSSALANARAAVLLSAEAADDKPIVPGLGRPVRTVRGCGRRGRARDRP